MRLFNCSTYDDGILSMFAPHGKRTGLEQSEGMKWSSYYSWSMLGSETRIVGL